MAYHFVAEPLSLLNVFTFFTFDRLFGKVLSYDGAVLKVNELFSKAILLPMFVYGDCMAVWSIFKDLSATGVAEMVKYTNWKGCPHTFVHIVYCKPHSQTNC